MTSVYYGVTQEAVAPPISIWALARTYLDECGGDVACTRAKLRADIEADAKLRDAIIDDAVSIAVQRVLTTANGSLRRSAWNSSGGPDKRGAVIALASGVVNSLYDFPLINGLKLGDAKRADVQKQADAYGTVIMDITGKRKFLLALVSKLGDGKSVRQVFSEEELASVKREALK